MPTSIVERILDKTRATKNFKVQSRYIRCTRFSVWCDRFQKGKEKRKIENNHKEEAAGLTFTCPFNCDAMDDDVSASNDDSGST